MHFPVGKASPGLGCLADSYICRYYHGAAIISKTMARCWRSLGTATFLHNGVNPQSASTQTKSGCTPFPWLEVTYRKPFRCANSIGSLPLVLCPKQMEPFCTSTNNLIQTYVI
jgi:hypothetical protein